MSRPALVTRTVAAMLLAAAAITAQTWGQSQIRAPQTVKLSPKTMEVFALKNSTAVLSAKYGVQAEEYAKKAAFTAFLPHLTGSMAYVHLNEILNTLARGSRIPPGFRGPVTVNSDGTVDTTSLDLRILTDLLGLFSNMPLAPLDNWNIGFTISQPLFMGGAVANGYRAASYNYLSKKSQYERARQDIRFAALQLFWNYVQVQESRTALESTLYWFEELVKDQAHLFDEGMILEEDLLKVKTQYSMMKLSVLRLQNGISDLRDNILVFCNLPLTTQIVLDSSSLLELDRTAVEPKPDLDGVLLHREDISAMQFQTEALTSLKKVQMGAYLPNLFGAYTNSYKNDDPSNTDRLRHTWNVAITSQWNIFDWGRQWREVQKTQTQIAQLKLGLESKKNEVRAQVARVARKVGESVKAEALAYETVENARRALASVEMRYREGQVSSTDLLSSRKDLTQAEIDLVKARIDKVLAVAEYNTAVGEEE